MVRRFNQRQVFFGVVNLFMSLVASAVAFLFFWFVLSRVVHAFHLGMPEPMQLLSAGGLVGVVMAAGILQWRRGEGHESYADSSVNVQLEWVSGGAYAVERYAQRVTAPAYVLTQIFLGGPLQLMKGISRFRSLITSDPQFETRLVEMLEEIRLRKTWHPIAAYAGREKELSALVRMDAVEYSVRKGTLRTKQSAA
jgi:hypothetical protein